MIRSATFRNILVFSSLTPTATGNYLINALRRAGHGLLVYSDTPGENADLAGGELCDAADLARRRGFRPDLLLFIEGGTMRLFPVGIEKLECLTAWYGIDTHMDYSKHLRIGRLFDVSFIAQKQYVESLRADGLRQVFWLPLAFAPELHSGAALPRHYEVAYVGSRDAAMHPARRDLLAAIRREFAPVHLGPASPQEMGRIYSQARIVFNKSVRNDVNMRYFEAMGAGAVLVTDRVSDNGVEDLFERGRHFLEYEDEPSLLRIIAELRAEPERCRAMGEAARKWVLERHTYDHRAQALVEALQGCAKCAVPSPDAYLSAFLALRLPVAALRAAADAFDWRDGGRGQRQLGKLIRVGLLGLAGVVRLLARAGARARPGG